jgi:signal transduction histidine kinase
MITNTKKTDVFKIKPAARHILTIGRDLIKDNATALLELIKNSYDADATHVSIEFSRTNKGKNASIKISVSDNGHGMSYKTVTTVWMVPSTFYKHGKLVSEEKKRPLQGRKGIGRYAASILGNGFRLETTKKGETTTLFINWEDFENKKYLEDIEISIDREKTGKSPGTYIEITGNSDKLLEWDKTQIEDFIKDLRRLISPIYEKEIKTDFEIELIFKDFPIETYENETIDIKPFPILEAFDYRISGEISGSGQAKLLFENGTAGNINEKIPIFNIPLEDGAKYCGRLKVDFKVYDRDTDSINNLIKKIRERGDSSETSEKLSRIEARKLLDEISGIAVYRGGFRVRPHGDPGYDWLELDRRRVQKPGVRVGSDRVSGFVEIEPEEESHLEEKANREGLKENKYFLGLKQAAISVLLQAEIRRYQFKIKTGQERSQRNLTEKLDSLFDFSDVTQTINKELTDRDVPESERKKIVGLIDARVEESNKVIEDVKRIIAIYQGQATIGKIVKVVLHEGRNPLSYFQNEIPVMGKWIEELKKKFNKKLLNQLVDRLGAVKRQAESLVSLFRKISPLAARRKANPAILHLKKNLEEIIDIFSYEFKKEKIKVTLDCDPDIQITAWAEDVSQTVINLLDNSLYWLSNSKNRVKEITITGAAMGEMFRLTYKDNGPGIEEKFIRDEVIFEPGFTTKPNGTGLGLAIAGEAMERSGGKLAAVYSESGAHFEIDLPLKTEEKSKKL